MVSSLDNPLPVAVGITGLAGDEQADFSVHGGLEKAVYAYPVQHYDFWRDILGVTHPVHPELRDGFVGENLTIEGFDEDHTWVGDIWRIGNTELQVVKLREPCFKFNARMKHKGAAKAMIQSARSGWYLQVNQPGTIRAGDLITVAPGRRETNIRMQNERLLRKEQQKDLF